MCVLLNMVANNVIIQENVQFKQPSFKNTPIAVKYEILNLAHNIVCKRAYKI